MTADPELKDVFQQALAQVISWLAADYDGAKLLYDAAQSEGHTWEMNQGLLFMCARGWRLYFRATGRPESDLILGLQQGIVNLAALEDDSPDDD